MKLFSFLSLYFLLLFLKKVENYKEDFRLEISPKDGKTLNVYILPHRKPIKIKAITRCYSFTQQDGVGWSCSEKNTLRMPIEKNDIRYQAIDRVTLPKWHKLRYLHNSQNQFHHLQIDFEKGTEHCVSVLSVPRDPPLPTSSLPTPSPLLLQQQEAKEEEEEKEEEHVREQRERHESNAVIRIYAIVFFVGSAIAIAIYAAVKYYLRVRNSKVDYVAEKRKDNAMENIKKAFTLGMYRPGTIIQTKTTRTTIN